MRTAGDMQSMNGEQHDGMTQHDGIATQAKEKIEQATGHAKQAAARAAEQAKGTVREQLDQRSTDIGQKIRAQTDSLRMISTQLRNEGNTVPAQLIDKASDHATRLGEYLERSDADAILSDVEQLARRQPWLVAATAFGVGLIAARMLKASGEQRSAQSSNELDLTEQIDTGQQW